MFSCHVSSSKNCIFKPKPSSWLLSLLVIVFCMLVCVVFKTAAFMGLCLFTDSGQIGGMSYMNRFATNSSLRRCIYSNQFKMQYLTDSCSDLIVEYWTVLQAIVDKFHVMLLKMICWCVKIVSKPLVMHVVNHVWVITSLIV